MKRKANYHSHVALCGHAEGVVEDYVKEAIKHNYEEIGISDHAPVPTTWMTPEEYDFFWLNRQMTQDDFYKEYLPQLEFAIEKYKDENIKILKAAESEYVEGKEKYYKQMLSHLDYLVLGVHFYESSGKLISSYEPLTEEDLYHYALIIEKAFATKLYKVLAHPDLFLYHVKEFTPVHEEVTKRIVQAAMRHDVYLEVNANGFYHNKYPRVEFWNVVKQFPDVKIIINSDAHYFKDFHGENVEKAIKFSKDLGLNISSKIVL